MAILVCIHVDIDRGKFEHRGFTIEHSIDGWDWTHKDYRTNGIAGTCDSVFEAIEAVEYWYYEGHTMPTMPDPDHQRDDNQAKEAH